MSGLQPCFPSTAWPSPLNCSWTSCGRWKLLFYTWFHGKQWRRLLIWKLLQEKGSGSSLVNICRALWSWKALRRRDLYFVLGLLGFEQWYEAHRAALCSNACCFKHNNLTLLLQEHRRSGGSWHGSDAMREGRRSLSSFPRSMIFPLA